MHLVLDASVVLKWFFRTRSAETDTDSALALLKAVGTGAVTLHQPAHFIIEVAAVLARELPADATSLLHTLTDIRMRIVGGPEVMACAIDLAVRHQHHLFDTLYHAVALQTEGAMLVTADSAYLRRAGAEGRIVSLAEYRLPD